MDAADAGDLPAVAAAFENTPAIIWMFAGDEHRIVAANRQARASVGNRPGLLGVAVREAVPEVDGQHIVELLDSVRRTGVPAVGVERRFEVDRTGDGRLEERFFNFSVVPVTAADGETGLLAHVIDVTDLVRKRRAAEAEAEDARERLRAEHRVTLDLQRSLLPPGLPVLPDLGLGAAYVPAGQWLAAGGDWYDAVVMPGDQVGLVVGDVVGHGSTASGTMGQLRAVAAERLAGGCDVARVLEALDAMSGLVPDARGSSVCVAVLDRDTGALEYASRGHPLPVVLAADGTTRVLAGPPGPPLGFSHLDSPVLRDGLRAGETLVLFSDGVVERPGMGILEGTAELRRCLSEVARTGEPVSLAERVCQAAAAHLVDRQTSGDDVIVLAATMLSAGAPALDLTLPGTADQLATVHRELGRWLDDLAVSDDDRIAVELAVIEAVTNSIEHGYRNRTGSVVVSGELTHSGSLAVVVADSGTWLEPSTEDSFRGRGLMMMRECTDFLDLDASAAGTTVHMRRRVHRSPTGPARRPSAIPASTTLTVDTTTVNGTAQLVLSGMLDSTSAPRLRSAIAAATRSGSRSCTVLLDSVTLLASAALRVLFEQQAQLNAADCNLVLYASPNTPAQAALQVSGLDQLLTVTPPPQP